MLVILWMLDPVTRCSVCGVIHVLLAIAVGVVPMQVIHDRRIAP